MGLYGLGLDDGQRAFPGLILGMVGIGLHTLSTAEALDGRRLPILIRAMPILTGNEHVAAGTRLQPRYQQRQRHRPQRQRDIQRRPPPSITTASAHKAGKRIHAPCGLIRTQRRPSARCAHPAAPGRQSPLHSRHTR
ncbi:hypothetical protein ABIE67_009766 [Streptomyces sp. V4I8]